MQLQDVMDMLGHSEPKTTLSYRRQNLKALGTKLRTLR
jgi:hypothetical protein